MLDKEIAFKIIRKLLKQPNFFYSQPFTLPKDAPAKCYLFHDFWFKFYEKFCGPYPPPYTKLWQSCSDPHLKIRPIAIFAFYSLNYSLAARLQDNSRPRSPTKVETTRKLQQFTVSGWLITNGGESGNEKKKSFKVEITFNIYEASVQLLARIIIFVGY